MRILNVTPDSFSDGGKFVASEHAVAHGLALVADGADLIDIGGESTRPGAEPVSVDEELRRVIPVIEQLAAQVKVPISVDTSKSAVAQAALRAGATVVNDVSGLTWDPQMLEVCSEHRCGIVCMHTLGTPKTMQINPVYTDVVGEIVGYFAERLQVLDRTGIQPERVDLVMGVGFSHIAEHNLQVLSRISRFHQFDRPILIGHSRKRFLQKVLGKPLDERVFGTVGVSIALAQQQVDILRLHDVAANRDAIVAWQATRPATR